MTTDVETPEYTAWEAARLEVLDTHRAALVTAVERAETLLEAALTALYEWDE